MYRQTNVILHSEWETPGHTSNGCKPIWSAKKKKKICHFLIHLFYVMFKLMCVCVWQLMEGIKNKNFNCPIHCSISLPSNFTCWKEDIEEILPPCHLLQLTFRIIGIIMNPFESNRRPSYFLCPHQLVWRKNCILAELVETQDSSKLHHFEQDGFWNAKLNVKWLCAMEMFKCSRRCSARDIFYRTKGKYSIEYCYYH